MYSCQLLGAFPPFCPPMLQLDPIQREARWQGRLLPLHGPAFDLLTLLARNPGEPIPSPRLMRALWPNRHVDPANLRMQVAVLRLHLGRSAVHTVRGRGYLLTIPVKSLAADTAAANRTRDGLLAGTLPLQQDELIGRDECVRQVEALLLKQHRLVCLLGPGGIGKTRLALQMAHTIREQPLPGGVLWVDLLVLSEADASTARLCQCTADAGGLQWSACDDAQAAHRLGQILHQATGGKAALLVLDNAEHVIGPLAAAVPAMLAAAPALRVLVTSQHALALPFGQVLWVQPLAVPAPGADEADIRASPAVRLLLRRAQAVHPNWEPTATDWPAIGTLVCALDGLALAIELAASRLPLLGARRLCEHLTDRLKALAINGLASRPQHMTLRAALDWSFALLPLPEKAALGQLSVFTVPFQLHSAVRTLCADRRDDAEAERALQGLVEHSMLQLIPGDAHGAPARLRLAESTRAYAQQVLQAEGPAAVRACEQRHGQAMAALARRACEDFLDASDAAWIARWLPELEEFQRAFDNARDRDDAEVAADVIEALVLSANITGNNEPALKRWQATRELAERAPPLARAKLLGWGNLAQSPGTTRLAQSAQRIKAWRAVVPQEGRRGLCVALAMHAVACQDAGDAAAADAALMDCMALESPEWPVRLRRRCSWIALTRLAIARDDDALLARAGHLSARMALELQQQGAWREHTLVQGQQALMLRLRGHAQAAAALLAKAAHAQLQLGCGLDAGRSLALQCAALVEDLTSHTPSVPASSADGWHAARLVATRALALLEPYPTQILHVVEALADMAAGQGEPELAAQLLSGAAGMRQAQQLGRDRLTDQASRRAWLQVRPLLDADTLDRCSRQGSELSPEALRMLALRWLTRPDVGGPVAALAGQAV